MTHQAVAMFDQEIMYFYWLVLGILAVWRVTHLLTAESGPWGAFARLRRLAGTGFWGALAGCFYCSSLWVAAPCAFVLGEHWKEQLLLWPALSGAAILLERVTERDAGIEPATYAEEEEKEYVLRQK
jgi:hypothetical protein